MDLKINTINNHSVVSTKPKSAHLRSTDEFQKLLEQINGQKGKSDVKESHSINESHSKLSFSYHALERAIERGISVSQDMIEKLQTAYQKAKTKGMREVAVLADNLIYIINVKDAKVVTVMNQNHLKDQVVTNIDGLVLA